jgi:minor histocompatibility antigen H13
MDSVVLGGTAVLAVGLGSYFAGRDDLETPKEIMSAKRVKSYPYLAALSLLSVDILMESLGPSTVNFMFMFYFGLAGTNSIWFLLRTFIKIRGRKLFMYPRSRTVITEFILPATSVPFHAFDLVLYAIGLAVNVHYFRTRHNITNNIIAFAISFFAVLSIRIEKFTSVAPLLWSLVIYDVFFVYQTDVMSKVALTLDGPVKLIYNVRGSGSVLGLGDIVLPGLFLSVCSRFDAFLYKLVRRRTPYWIVGMIGYALALALTDVICHLTHSGQPALLYIVPALTVPTVLLAVVRKEHFAFMSFSG